LAVRCDFIFCGVHVRIFQKKSVWSIRTRAIKNLYPTINFHLSFP
jgi:hypothetical protein